MTGPAAPARWTAPAKVNLYLRVTGRRADGFHLLDSLVTFVALADTLDHRPADTLSLAVEGPFADGLAGEDNLVLRAARALAARSGRMAAGAALTLRKEIPVAAGLGGGSGDAAAALRGLNAAWRCGLDQEALLALAAGLGADVPACLLGRPLLVAGIGETLREAPVLPPHALLLVNPNRPLATADVFHRRHGAFSPPRPLTEAPADAAALAAALRERGNDLTETAVALCPEVAQVLAALAPLPGCLLAQMSGSGATCFGLFGDEEAAASAGAVLAARHPGWFVRAAGPAAP